MIPHWRKKEILCSFPLETKMCNLLWFIKFSIWFTGKTMEDFRLGFCLHWMTLQNILLQVLVGFNRWSKFHFPHKYLNSLGSIWMRREGGATIYSSICTINRFLGLSLHIFSSFSTCHCPSLQKEYILNITKDCSDRPVVEFFTLLRFDFWKAPPLHMQEVLPLHVQLVPVAQPIDWVYRSWPTELMR